MNHTKSFFLFALALLWVSSVGMAAERSSSSGYRYFETAESHTPWMMPGINIASPAGYGASWGSLGIGAGFQNRTRNTQASDGSMGAAFGIGDSAKYVGLETAVAVLSMTGDDAWERGSVSFKLHRQLPEGFSVAAGRETAIYWGGTDASRTWYGSVSKIFYLKDPSELFSALTLTAGVGDGRFRSETDVSANRTTVNVFGSAAVRILEPVSFIADWAGQDLALGLSITPFRTFALYLNPSLVDVTGNAGDGVRFLMSLGIGYTFG